MAAAGLLVFGLIGGASRTLHAPDRFERARGSVPDASVEQVSGPPLTAELAALPSIGTVASVTFVFGMMLPITTASDAPGQPVETLVFAGTQAGFGGVIVDGREPDPTAPSEFMASASFIEVTGAELGDTFELVTLTQKQGDDTGFDAAVPEGPSLTATLVGTFTGPVEMLNKESLVIFPPTLLSQGDIGISATPHLITLTGGATLDDLRRDLDTLPDPDQLGLSPAELISSDAREAVRARGLGLSVLAAVVGGAVAIVLGQFLRRQVRLGEAESRVLRSLGMTRKDRHLDQILRAIGPTVVGATAAAVLAYVLSGLFPLGFVAGLDPSGGRHLEPAAHLLGPGLLSLVLIGWVAFAVSLDDRHARRNRSSSNVASIAPPLGSSTLTLGARFAFAAPDRRRAPLVGSLVGLVVVLALAVGASVFGASLARLLTIRLSQDGLSSQSAKAATSSPSRSSTPWSPILTSPA